MFALSNLVAALTLVVLDSIYLNLIKNYFNKQIKSIQGSDIQVNFVGVGITYVLLIFAIIYFIIQKHRSPRDAALLGFCIYGVYEFTNYALFKKWTLLTAIIDTAWGTLLFYLTALITYSL
jgi:uncharacterized membrane protein